MLLDGDLARAALDRETRTVRKDDKIEDASVRKIGYAPGKGEESVEIRIGEMKNASRAPKDSASLPTDWANLPMDLLMLADPSVEYVTEYLHGGIVFTAKDGNEIVGILVMSRTRPGTMEIMNVAVREAYQNKGIGRKLIESAIAKAKREGMKTLHIGTGNPGVTQMLLYQKCGFRIVGVEFDFFRKRYREKMIENGVECRDMIRMEMDL